MTATTTTGTAKKTYYLMTPTKLKTIDDTTTTTTSRSEGTRAEERQARIDAIRAKYFGARKRARGRRGR
jgi:hypothetical protein